MRKSLTPDGKISFVLWQGLPNRWTIKMVPKGVGDFHISYFFLCLISFLTKHFWFCLHSIERFPAKLFIHRWSKLSIFRYTSVSWHFIKKYNVPVFCKYIINASTTSISTCKKIFYFGQREFLSFFTLVTNKGELSIISSK
jgi:hypothetical protein